MKIEAENMKYTAYKTRGNVLSELVQNFHRLERPLTFVEIDSGMILPVKPASGYKWGLGGVMDRNHMFVQESVHPGFAKDKDTRFGGWYSVKKESIHRMEETVIYCDPIILQWGHFLVDSISRLWYAVRNPNMKIAFCGYGFAAGKLGSPYTDFFKYLGIPVENLIDIRRPTEFKKIIVPEMSYVADLYYSDEYTHLFDVVGKNVEVSCAGKMRIAERIYFTRCQFKGNGVRFREIGEKELEEILQYNGYEVIAPEQHTFEEQILLYRNCRSFASLSGTVAHNILFAHSLEELIVLNKTSHIQRQQYYLNHMKQIRETNIDVFREPFIGAGIPVDTGAGPYILGYTKCLSLWMKEAGLKMPHNLGYYQARWVRNYVWLIVILPIRRLKALCFLFVRVLRKLKPVTRTVDLIYKKFIK